jgi:hypothetical protein
MEQFSCDDAAADSGRATRIETQKESQRQRHLLAVQTHTGF